MPTHYGGTKMEKKMPKVAMSKMTMSKMKSLSDQDYYKEHSKHHSAKHIKAMKELQKLGVNREKAHSYVKKYVD